MTNKPFYNTFHFTQYGTITQSPTANRIGYAVLSDGTHIELRNGVFSLQPPLTRQDLTKGKHVTITFTLPEETQYPQAIHLSLKKPNT